MSRIKIKDLPQDMTLSKEEMKKMYGGVYNSKLLPITFLAGNIDPNWKIEENED